MMLAVRVLKEENSMQNLARLASSKTYLHLAAAVRSDLKVGVLVVCH